MKYLAAALLLVLSSLTLACDSTVEREFSNPMLAYDIGDDTVALFFSRQVGDEKLSHVQIAYISENDTDYLIAFQADLSDYDFGVENVDMNAFAGTFLYLRPENYASVELWSHYSAPREEGEAVSLCLGTNFSYRVSELIPQ